MRLMVCALFAGLLVENGAAATNALGTYVSVGAGRADVRADPTANLGIDFGSRFNESATGWTASLGIRPLRFLGAELQYFDFGHPGASNGTDDVDVQAEGPALLGVGYLPVPDSRFALYVKAGVGRVRSIATSRLHPGVYCVVASPECSNLRADMTGTRLGWGAGALLKTSLPLAVRAEYARFSAPGGGPDLLSLSLTWAF